MKKDPYKNYVPKLIQNTTDHFVSYGRLLKDAVLYRQSIDVSKTAKYGVKILDEYLGGILDNELVIVGAETGMGKSELAYLIGIENAMRGKKVLMLGLEGDIYEIAFRHIQREFKKFKELDPDFKVNTIAYRFNLDESLHILEEDILEDIDNRIKENLLIFNKEAIPSLEFIQELIVLMRDQVDLIVIDHLHYIDFSDENENAAIGKTMRTLKTLTDIIRRPIVMMAQFKKIEPNRDGTKRDPTRYDLYGSSQISKEATTIILIGKGVKEQVDFRDDKGRGSNRYGATRFICDKSRIGIPTPSKFEAIFDTQEKYYIESSMVLGEDSAIKETDRLPVPPPAAEEDIFEKKKLEKEEDGNF